MISIGMRARSTTGLLALCLLSSCARLIGADFDRGGAQADGGDGKTAEAGNAGDAKDALADAAHAETAPPPPTDGGDAGDKADARDDSPDAIGDAPQDDGPDVSGDGPQDDRSDADLDTRPDGDGAGVDGSDGADARDGGIVDVHPDIGEPSVPPTLYVAATTENKGLWLFRVPIGSAEDYTTNIPPPVDVTAQIGPLAIDDVEIQSVGREVFLLARVGSNVHIASVRDSAWTAWQPVTTGVRAISLANVEGYLWACLTGTDGHLRLMSRGDDGVWQDQGDVTERLPPIPDGGAPLASSKVDCAGVGPDLAIFVLDTYGHLWEGTKTPDVWSTFSNIPGPANDPFVDIDASNATGDLHALASSMTRQYHEVIPPSGPPSGFSEVEPFTGDPPGDIVASAQASLLAEVEWLQLNTAGEIWISTRYRCCAGVYRRLAKAAPTARPFLSLSATGVLPF
jgi:hypothetical protein